MNKAEFIGAVATAMSSTKEDAAKAVDGVIGAISTAMTAGDPVKITGFGVFERKTRKAHIARNPATGAAVEVPEKRTVKFRAGRDLEARL